VASSAYAGGRGGVRSGSWPQTAALSRRGSAKNGESGRPSGPQMVPMRRQAEGLGPQVFDRIGEVVAARRQVHYAGDLVLLAEVEEGRLVGAVERLDHDPARGLARQVPG
jgi:hypothetical protein